MFHKKSPKLVEKLTRACEKCDGTVVLKKLKIKNDFVRAKMVGSKHDLYYRLDPEKKDEWLDSAVDLFFRCNKCGKKVSRFKYWRAWEFNVDGTDRELPNKKIIKLKVVCLEHGKRMRKIHHKFLDEFISTWRKQAKAKKDDKKDDKKGGKKDTKGKKKTKGKKNSKKKDE